MRGFILTLSHQPRRTAVAAAAVALEVSTFPTTVEAGREGR